MKVISSTPETAVSKSFYITVQKITKMIQVAKSLYLQSLRTFSNTSNVIPSITKLTDKFTQRSLELYKQNKVDVDKELDKVRINSLH